MAQAQEMRDQASAQAQAAYDARAAQIQADLETRQAQIQASAGGTLAQQKQASRDMQAAEQRAIELLREARNERATAQQGARSDYDSTVVKTSPGTDYVQGSQGRTAQENAAIRQGVRESFVASGQSRQAGAQEVEQARRDVRGGEITQVRDAAGNTFQGQVSGGEFIGTRSVSPAERASADAARASAPAQAASQFDSTLLRAIREGKTAGEAFPLLGAPTTREVGEITFGRQPEKSLAQRGVELLTGKTSAQADEPSRTSKIFETSYVVPNAASAQLAGFSLTDASGNPVRFPATFSALREERTDYAPKGFVEVNTPAPIQAAFTKVSAGVDALDQAGIVLAQRGEPTFKGIVTAGKLLEATGGALESAGATIKERYPSLNPGALLVGGFVQRIGEDVQARPVTAGAGNAFLLGAGFGAASEGVTALREFGFIVREGELVAREGTLAAAARGIGATGKALEVGTGLALGTVFVVKTIQDVRSAPTQQEAGARLAQSAIELLAFGAGVRAGGALAGEALALPETIRQSVQYRRALAQTREEYGGEVITSSVAERLGQAANDVQADVLVQPITGRLAARETIERAGNAFRQSGRANILGEPVSISSEDLANVPEKFLVRRGNYERTIILEENQGPLNAESVQGLPQVLGPGGQEFRRATLSSFVVNQEGLGLEKLSLSSKEIVENGLPNDFATLFENKPSGILPGLRKSTQELSLDTFNPTEGEGLSGKKGKGGNNRAGSPRDFVVLNGVLDIAPERARLEKSSGGALEKVVRFADEKGSNKVLLQTEKGLIVQRGRAMLGVDFVTKRFKVQEFTEDREYPRGTKGFAQGVFLGRPMISTGELSAEQAGILEQQFSPREQPLIFKSLTKSVKPRAARGAGEAASGESGTAVGSGGQILLLKTKKGATSAKLQQQTVQETKVEQAQTQQTTQLSGSRQQQQQAQQEQRQQGGSQEQTFAQKVRGLARAQASSESKLSAAFDRAREASRQETRLASVLSSRSAQASRSILGTRQVLAQGQASLQDQAQAQASLTGQGSSLTTALRAQQRTRQETRTVQASRLISLTRLAQGGIPGELVPQPEKPKGGVGFPFTRKKAKEQGFGVLIKRGGVFERLTAVPLTRAQALAAGARATDVGAAQTFKVVPLQEEARSGEDIAQLDSGAFARKFRSLGGDMYRERKKAAIDTPGERSEITFKGIAASKAKGRGLRL